MNIPLPEALRALVDERVAAQAPASKRRVEDIVGVIERYDPPAPEARSAAREPG